MYYRLTFISSPDPHQRGASVVNGHRPLTIGQRAAHDVRLPEQDEFEPQLFASILPTDDGQGWYLVCQTESFPVKVNGREVTMSCRLADGDELAFGDDNHVSLMRFSINEKGDYDEALGVVYEPTYKPGLNRVWVALLALALVAGAAFVWSSSRRGDLRQEDLGAYHASVYHITTDSVSLLCDTVIDGRQQQLVVEAIELSAVSAGTCFVTRDSLLVTARHCVEPWISDEKWDGMASYDRMSPEVRMAVKAETENRRCGRNKYWLRAHCVVTLGLERYELHSTDFTINRSRDMVMTLGTTQDPIYWRTIFPIAHRRDMELGDFAFMRVAGLMAPGSLDMATDDELRTFAHSGGAHEIAVLGYPLNDNDADNALVTVYGNSQAPEYDTKGTAIVGCIQMYAPINPGNSGGPVLARVDGKMRVVGIVSKADGRASQGMFWAVPITEVTAMQHGSAPMPNDTIYYRR